MATRVAQNTKPNARKTGGKTTAKRPAARRVQKPKSSFARILLQNLQWLFLAGAAVVIGVLLFVGYQRTTASEFFALKRVDVSGAQRASVETIEKTVRAMTAKTGVWNADLPMIQNEIEQISWVKTAAVSRVLPDGLRVRVTEREPKAVVRLNSGDKVWVDDEARILGEVKQGENAPFVIQGWNEAKDNEATRKNQDRLRLYQKMLDEWRKAEVANQVTAVNLADLQDVEVTVQQTDATIQIQIGNQNFGERLKTALTQIENLKNNDGLEQVERIIVYDRTPVVRMKTGNAANSKEVSTQRKPLR